MMINSELLQSLFFSITKHSKDTHQTAGKLLMSNYLNYLSKVADNKSCKKEIILTRQLDVLREHYHLSEEQVHDIVDDINHSGDKHRALLEEDSDLIDRLASIFRGDYSMAHQPLPAIMHSGLTHQEIVNLELEQTNKVTTEELINIDRDTFGSIRQGLEALERQLVEQEGKIKKNKEEKLKLEFRIQELNTALKDFFSPI